MIESSHGGFQRNKIKMIENLMGIIIGTYIGIIITPSLFLTVLRCAANIENYMEKNIYARIENFRF